MGENVKNKMKRDTLNNASDGSEEPKQVMLRPSLPYTITTF
jgi:hypothetical protein